MKYFPSTGNQTEITITVITFTNSHLSQVTDQNVFQKLEQIVSLQCFVHEVFIAYL
uniref:Uncharacterized protein n=1 Tax=Arion vulgaris TaxID=1028688 RepID=A0A0B7BC46_9EUPU